MSSVMSSLSETEIQTLKNKIKRQDKALEARDKQIDDLAALLQRQQHYMHDAFKKQSLLLTFLAKYVSNRGEEETSTITIPLASVQELIEKIQSPVSPNVTTKISNSDISIKREDEVIIGPKSNNIDTISIKDQNGLSFSAIGESHLLSKNEEFAKFFADTYHLNGSKKVDLNVKIPAKIVAKQPKTNLNPMRKIRCDACNKNFISKLGLLKHIKDFHQKNLIDSNEKVPESHKTNTESLNANEKNIEKTNHSDTTTNIETSRSNEIHHESTSQEDFHENKTSKNTNHQLKDLKIILKDIGTDKTLQLI